MITFNAHNLPISDIIALFFFFVSWYSYSVISDIITRRDNNGVLSKMHVHRLNWMKLMVRRESRLADVNAVGNLMRSISFFASTTVLIIVGLVGLLGNQDKLNKVIDTIPFASETDALFWEIKIGVMAILFIFAFFKFTWSLRQYNYLNVMIIGAPIPSDGIENAEQFAVKAAELATNAARHFGYGLRAYYFALAVLSWFINPYIFIAATFWTVCVLYRREFRSRTLTHIS